MSFSVCVLASTSTMNAMLCYPSGSSHIVASLGFVVVVVVVFALKAYSIFLGSFAG